MTDDNSSTIIVKPTVTVTVDLPNTLIAINVPSQLLIKLTSQNYSVWRAQYRALLIRYDLLGYLDNSKPCPPETISVPDSTKIVPNPVYTLWVRQDQLFLSVIIGSVSATLVPFIASAPTSLVAWFILDKTYALPMRGRIMELHSKLANPKKYNQTVVEYMQCIKTTMDALALMNKLVDFDELSVLILLGLGPSYTKLDNAFQVRDTAPTFEELFDKLVSYEAQLNLFPRVLFASLATAFATPNTGGLY